MSTSKQLLQPERRDLPRQTRGGCTERIHRMCPGLQKEVLRTYGILQERGKQAQDNTICKCMGTRTGTRAQDQVVNYSNGPLIPERQQILRPVFDRETPHPEDFQQPKLPQQAL